MHSKVNANEGRFIPLRLRSSRNWRRVFVVRVVSEALVFNFINRTVRIEMSMVYD